MRLSEAELRHAYPRAQEMMDAFEVRCSGEGGGGQGAEVGKWRSRRGRVGAGDWACVRVRGDREGGRG